MAKESTEFINEAVKEGKGKMGYGESVALALDKSNGPYLEHSLLYNAYKLNIPFTVHSALGTEIIHQHPSVDGAAVGDTTWTDFQIFTKNVSTLDKLEWESLVIENNQTKELLSQPSTSFASKINSRLKKLFFPDDLSNYEKITRQPDDYK